MSQIGDEIGDLSTEADSQTANEACRPGVTLVTSAYAASSSASADDGSSTHAATPNEQASRQSNLQRIQQRKQQVYSWPHTKKLLKLAIYSACQTPDCNCNGWKTQMPVPVPKGNARTDIQPLASFGDPCRNCHHVLEKHVTQLQGLPVAEVNRLLGTVVDVENIFMSMHREDDHDTKRVYYYLFKILRKCILTRTHPRIEGPLKQPPFERPSIAKAITNFVLYKFNTLPQREWQTMYDLAKMFLHCFNHWNFETPSVRRLQVANAEELAAYQMNYTRWLVFCHVPAFCDSLPHYDTSLVFGRQLLRAVFKSVCRQLMDKCHSERDRMPPEKRVLVLTHFPRFLALLEEEIFAANSPIWDPDYKQIPPTHLQNVLENKPGTIKTESGAVKRGSESRAAADPPSGAKRRRIIDEFGDDVSDRTVADIVATINDPNYMCGPDTPSHNLQNKVLLDSLEIQLEGMKKISIPSNGFVVMMLGIERSNEVPPNDNIFDIILPPSRSSISNNNISNMPSANCYRQEVMPTTDGSHDKPSTNSSPELVRPTTDLSQDMVASNNSEEIMPTTNDSQDMLALSDNSEKIMATVDGSRDMPAARDDSQEVMPTAEGSQDMLAASDNTKKIIPTNNGSQDMSAGSGNSEDIRPTTDGSQDMPAGSGNSEDVLPTTDGSQDMPAGSDNSKGIMVTTAGSQDNQAASDNSKEKMLATDGSQDMPAGSCNADDILPTTRCTHDVPSASRSALATDGTHDIPSASGSSHEYLQLPIISPGTGTHDMVSDSGDYQTVMTTIGDMPTARGMTASEIGNEIILKRDNANESSVKMSSRHGNDKMPSTSGRSKAEIPPITEMKEMSLDIVMPPSAGIDEKLQKTSTSSAKMPATATTNEIEPITVRSPPLMPARSSIEEMSAAGTPNDTTHLECNSNLNGIQESNSANQVDHRVTNEAGASSNTQVNLKLRERLLALYEQGNSNSCKIQKSAYQINVGAENEAAVSSNTQPVNMNSPLLRSLLPSFVQPNSNTSQNQGFANRMNDRAANEAAATANTQRVNTNSPMLQSMLNCYGQPNSNSSQMNAGAANVAAASANTPRANTNSPLLRSLLPSFVQPNSNSFQRLQYPNRMNFESANLAASPYTRDFDFFLRLFRRIFSLVDQSDASFNIFRDLYQLKYGFVHSNIRLLHRHAWYRRNLLPLLEQLSSNSNGNQEPANFGDINEEQPRASSPEQESVEEMTIYNRNEFFQMEQESDETFEFYLDRLRDQLDICDFHEDDVTRILISQISRSCTSEELRRRILAAGPDVTLGFVILNATLLENADPNENLLLSEGEDPEDTD